MKRWVEKGGEGRWWGREVKGGVGKGGGSKQ